MKVREMEVDSTLLQDIQKSQLEDEDKARYQGREVTRIYGR
jgi:hypothetical protein